MYQITDPYVNADQCVQMIILSKVGKGHMNYFFLSSELKEGSGDTLVLFMRRVSVWFQVCQWLDCGKKTFLVRLNLSLSLSQSLSLANTLEMIDT